LPLRKYQNVDKILTKILKNLAFVFFSCIQGCHTVFKFEAAILIVGYFTSQFQLFSNALQPETAVFSKKLAALFS